MWSENKSAFDSLVSQQHFFLDQKLPESVDDRQSYSVPSQCRFLKHGVEILLLW